MANVVTWANSTAYTVGTIAVDAVATPVTYWECEVAHTSAASPTTFAADRAAHATYWTQYGTYCSLVENEGWIKGVQIGTDSRDTIAPADKARAEIRAREWIDSNVRTFATLLEDPLTPPEVVDVTLMYASAMILRIHSRPQGRQGDSSWSRADWLESECQKWLDGVRAGRLVIVGDADFGGEHESPVATTDQLDAADQPIEPIFNETGIAGIGEGVREDVDTDGWTEYDTPGEIS